MITARFAPVESMCVLLVLLDPALVVLNPTAENQFANLDQTSRASPEPHCAPADQKQRLIGFVSQSALIPLRGHGFQQARCPSMAYYLNRVLSFAHLARTALRASGAERFLRRCGRFAPAVLSCAWRLLCLTSFGQRSAHSVTVKPVTVAAVGLLSPGSFVTWLPHSDVFSGRKRSLACVLPGPKPARLSALDTRRSSVLPFVSVAAFGGALE